jgi:hypothetical protein
MTEATGSEKPSAADDYISGPKFNALRCAIYHTERRNFFDLSNRGLNFLVIIFGAGVAGNRPHDSSRSRLLVGSEMTER